MTYQTNPDENTDVISDVYGEIIEWGRGDTDRDITYIALRNASGTKVYIFPDPAGTALVVQTTKP